MAEYADLDVVFDCADPDRVGRRPTIFFNRVAEPKVTKNRLHLDIKVARDRPEDERRARIEAETDRLVAAGATIVRRVAGLDGFWTVMHDVEGNEFCVI